MRLGILALAAVLTFQVAQAQEQRLALVIGNAGYKAAPLRNPVNDARAITTVLRAFGFEVLQLENATARTMKRAIVDFGNRIKGGGIGVFYYSGHGLQLRGQNFLVPVDAEIATEDDVDAESVGLNMVLDRMAEAKNRVNVVILDACRNNPFERRWRGAPKGLAAIDATTGTLIAYATSPGSTADDGEGANGLYTEALVKTIREPNLKVEEVFKRVRADVIRQTKGRQIPWESSSLTGDLVFNITVHVPPPAPAVDDRHFELAFWNSIKDSTTAAPFELYLKRFPSGTFADLAHLKIDSITSPQRQQVNPSDVREMVHAYDQRDYQKAYPLANKLAESGNAAAQNLLALLYRDGFVVRRDYTLALQWFRKAAEQGNGWAEGNLGEMYWHGRGVAVNYDEALQWGRRSAERGNVGGQNLLGAFYEYGVGVPANMARAIEWYQKAAEKDFPWGKVNLAWALIRGKGIKKDVNRAFALVTEALQQSNRGAQNLLGYMYKEGIGVERNDVAAVELFRKAAEQEWEFGQVNLGIMYEEGRGVPKDLAQARFWYKKAAEQNNSEAKRRLTALPGRP